MLYKDSSDSMEEIEIDSTPKLRGSSTSSSSSSGSGSGSLEEYHDVPIWRDPCITYAFSSLMYIIYAFGIMCNNYTVNGEIQDRWCVVLNVAHFSSACLYLYCTSLIRGYDPYLIWPDIMNIIEALLYFFSSTLYHDLYDHNGRYNSNFYLSRNLEFGAAVFEMGAALGWVWVWYVLHKENGEPTSMFRGFSTLDPDQWANVTILIAGIMYVVYCIQVSDTSQYESNILYQYADIIYFINSLFYTLAALRDLELEWSFILPSSKRAGYRNEIVYQQLQLYEMPTSSSS
jgi:hypothetical protein